MMTTINVGRDFSSSPFGRYRIHSDASGERFREEFLVPALLLDEPLRILLDDIDGEYGSSFLEESFGGLIREGMELEKVLAKLIIETRHKYLLDEIMIYMSDAERERAKRVK